MGRIRRRGGRAYAIPLALSGKQILFALGQRARQPAYLGAHRELLNCSRTFLGPQRLYGARSDAMPDGAFGIKVRGATRVERQESSRGSQ